MKLGRKHIKILGALAALWLGVFAVSDTSANSLNGASADKIVKFNYFSNRSSWMSPAMSPGGSIDAIRLGAMSLPGVVTGWADYVTWGTENERWSGVAEHVIAYNNVMDANVKLLRRILQEQPDLLLKNSRSEGITNDNSTNTVGTKIENKPFAMIKVNKTQDKPKPEDPAKDIDEVAIQPPRDDPPCASGC